MRCKRDALQGEYQAGDEFDQYGQNEKLEGEMKLSRAQHVGQVELHPDVDKKDWDEKTEAQGR
jgi:hypothetical protein